MKLNPKEVFTKHKILSSLAVIVLFGGGFIIYQKVKPNETKNSYMTAMVERGTLSASISCSGQVSVSNQLDVIPKVSGEVTYVGIKKGQEVKAWTLLVQLNASEALKTVRDAQTNLESAQLSMEKLLKPADDLSILQAENSLAQAQEAKSTAEDNLEKAYEDSYNAITDAFLDFPSIMSGLDDILYSYEISENNSSLATTDNTSALYNTIASVDDSQKIEMLNYINNAEDSYQSARQTFDRNVINYNQASRYSDNQAIEDLLSETLETAKLITESIKKTANMVDYWVDYRSQRNKTIFNQVTSYQSDLASFTSQANSQVSSLLSLQNSLKNYEENIVDADRSIAEKQVSYNQLLAGADELDIESQNITLRQKENSLADAKENLADYYIRAPFDGVVAEVDVKVGDDVSSGTVLVSLITKQQLATISLNEVDITKIKLGQKATLSFDAVEDLSLTGKVAEIDTLGTVTSGVVNYDVTIVFDTQDERIKPGMSVSVNIITDLKIDVLMVPNSAIKTQNDLTYVELMKDSIPTLQPIETGITNDVDTEVISCLKENDEIITQTFDSTSFSSNNQSASSQRDNVQGMMRIMPR